MQYNNNNAFVYTAEGLALSDAFDVAVDNVNKNLGIFTDSLIAIQLLNYTKFSIKTISIFLNIKRKYNLLNTYNNNRFSVNLF